MNIKVGEYIRTNKGYILKVDKEKKILNIIDFIDVKYGKIKSHSENLIDLIEVGDYINGYKVICINKEAPNNHYEGIELDRNNNYEYQFISKNKVKTILTKEQYEQNCYKVEE